MTASDGSIASEVDRRLFLASGVGSLASVAMPAWAHAVPRTTALPGTHAWPDEAAWAALDAAVGGRLSKVAMPAIAAADAPRLLSNPFFLGDEPALTQSSGWIDAWRSAPSEYVVRARTAADVAAAVRFARERNVRLVVKGGGHSYLGNSNAPDSLLVWTRDMDAVELHDAFVPAGSKRQPVPAVSVGAGCLWLRVYQAVTGKAGRYVQGGGCTTVGVAGFVQGGGFGSLSKTFGTGAANLLEAEIVTADGVVRTVSEVREPELFWALRGGGGGTFGIVTRMTLRTHPLPERFGAVMWQVKARSDDAYRTLLARFVDLYAERLFDPRWGEQARASRENTLGILMLFHSLSAAEARTAWKPLSDFVAAHPNDYDIPQPMSVLDMPSRSFWDEAYLRQHAPGLTVRDDRPGSRPTDYWWAGNTQEAGAFWHGYQSRWMPSSLLNREARARFVDAWFQASRHWSVTMHFNKGLAGGTPEALTATRETATNPGVLDAFALAIIAYDGPSAFPGLPRPDEAAARRDAAAIRAAADELRRVAPDAGSYMSESDYLLANWREAYWGQHWLRLEAIKRRFDPENLFIAYHGVGDGA